MNQNGLQFAPALEHLIKSQPVAIDKENDTSHSLAHARNLGEDGIQFTDVYGLGTERQSSVW